MQEVCVKMLEEMKLEKALRMQQSSEKSSYSQPQAEAAPGAKRLFHITRKASAKEEKKILEDGGDDAPFQSSVKKMEANETSDETLSDPTELPVNGCDPVKEKHAPRQQERGASQKEKAALSSVRGDEASYSTQVVGKPVLTAAHRGHSAPGKTAPYRVIPERGSRNLWNRGLNTECEMCSTDFGRKESSQIQRKCDAIRGPGCLSSQMGSQTQGCGDALCCRHHEVVKLFQLQQCPAGKGPPRKQLWLLSHTPLRINPSLCLRQKKNRKTVLCRLQPRLLQNPCFQKGSGPSSSQMATKQHPLNTPGHSTGKPRFSGEDDSKLRSTWILGKDEDDVLLELSEMIDSLS